MPKDAISTLPTLRACDNSTNDTKFSFSINADLSFFERGCLTMAEAPRRRGGFAA